MISFPGLGKLPRLTGWQPVLPRNAAQLVNWHDGKIRIDTAM